MAVVGPTQSGIDHVSLIHEIKESRSETEPSHNLHEFSMGMGSSVCGEAGPEKACVLTLPAMCGKV